METGNINLIAAMGYKNDNIKEKAKMIKVEITFDEDWLLQRRDDPIYPIENVKQLIEKEFKTENALDSNVSSLSFRLDEAEEIGEASIKEKISELINAEYDLTPGSPEYSVVISPARMTTKRIRMT